MPTIVLLGTFDSKGEELRFVQDELWKHPNVEVISIDVGKTPSPDDGVSVSSSLIAKYGSKRDEGGASSLDVGKLSRTELNKHMAAGAITYLTSLFEAGDMPLHGIIALGGSFGTSLASAVMRDACPVGFPKLIVSTVASGDTGPIVGETDITLMYSIVDIVGLNPILRNILTNSAGAIIGMSTAYEHFLQGKVRFEGSRNDSKKLIRLAISMFGVTTPCVDRIRAHLRQLSKDVDCPFYFELFIFHATGHGGRTMERLVSSGSIDAIIDLTTTEIADYIVGGVMSAGSTRLDAAAAAGIPTVLSVGAVDMANFGPWITVPAKFANRNLYEHNPTVTLMRTSSEECAEIGSFIAKKLRCYKGRSVPDSQGIASRGTVEVWLPTGGVNLMSGCGGPFEDRKADEALFEAIRKGLEGTGISIVERDEAINDQPFAEGVANALIKLLAH
ncbi:hypothetical protein GYMLUDRAFT_68333 [Collybiopsis luxurians FD-317 M1]|nr:hypothetical protein GYMLUDRAFT_68333 [Collybiopsis luxurians FD-317 M1]